MTAEEPALVLIVIMDALMDKVNDYLKTDPSWGAPEMQPSQTRISTHIKHNSGNTIIITVQLNDDTVGVHVSGSPDTDDTLWHQPIVSVVREFNNWLRDRLNTNHPSTEWVQVSEGCKLFTNRHIVGAPDSSGYINKYATYITHLVHVLTILPRIQSRTWTIAELGDLKLNNKFIELTHSSGIRFRVKFDPTPQGIKIETMRTVGDIESSAYESLITVIETFIEEFEDYESEEDNIIGSHAAEATAGPTPVPDAAAAAVVTDLKETMDNLSSLGEFISRFTIALMTFRDRHPDYNFQTAITQATAEFTVSRHGNAPFVVKSTVASGIMSIQVIDSEIPGISELKSMVYTIMGEFGVRNVDNNDVSSAERIARYIITIIDKINAYIIDNPIWSAPVVDTGDSRVTILIGYKSEDGAVGDARIVMTRELNGIEIKHYRSESVNKNAFDNLIAHIRSRRSE
jgi:hypothetical protein